MFKRTVKTEIWVASSEECASALGIHLRTFQQLMKDGWIDGKIAHNEYDFQRVARTYHSHVMLEARRKAS